MLEKKCKDKKKTVIIIGWHDDNDVIDQYLHIWTIHIQKIAIWGQSYSKQSIILLFKYFSCIFLISIKVDLNAKCLNQLELHSFNFQIESIVVKSINGIQGERRLIMLLYYFIFISKPLKNVSNQSLCSGVCHLTFGDPLRSFANHWIHSWSIEIRFGSLTSIESLNLRHYNSHLF